MWRVRRFADRRWYVGSDDPQELERLKQLRRDLWERLKGFEEQAPAQTLRSEIKEALESKE